MKKYRLSLIIILILAILAVIILINNSGGTFKKKNNEFAVSDTANITKFFLADKNNNTVKVERKKDGNWLVNDKYTVNPNMIEVIMKTFISIDIKAPVAKSKRNTILRVMAGKSVKTEIYQKVYRINLFDIITLFPHEKLTKTYYVGDATQDNSGTFMLMEGSEDPYIVYIPGFRGFVSTRYSAMEIDWRSHSIFRSRVPDISSVSVIFNRIPENSFRINNQNSRVFTLTSVLGNRNIEWFDTIKVVSYLSVFRNLNYERVLDEMTKTKYDSIVSNVPTYEVILTDKFGKSHTLKTWKRKADIGQLDIDGNQTEWDMERMYGLIDNSEHLVSVQYFAFNNVLVPLQWFLQQKSGNQ